MSSDASVVVSPAPLPSSSAPSAASPSPTNPEGTPLISRPFLYSLLLNLFSGLLLAFYNKWLLDPEYYNFPYPIAVIFIQMTLNFFYSTVALVLIRKTSRASFMRNYRREFAEFVRRARERNQKEKEREESLSTSPHSAENIKTVAKVTEDIIFNEEFHRQRIKYRILRIVSMFVDSINSNPFHPFNVSLGDTLGSLIPIGVFFGADILFTNIAYRDISVSLTEIIKSFIPIILMISSIMDGRIVGNSYIYVMVSFLCVGVGFASYGSMEFDWIGFIAAIIAVLSASSKFIKMESLVALQAGKSKQEQEEEMTVPVEATDQTNTAIDIEGDGKEEKAGNNGNNNDTGDKDKENPQETKEKTLPDEEIPNPKKQEEKQQGTKKTSHGKSNRNPPVTTKSTKPPSTYVDPYEDNLVDPDISTAAHERLPPLLGLFYFTPISAVFLLLPLLIIEFSALQSSPRMDGSHWVVTMGLIVIGSIMLFISNLSELLIIKLSSSLSLCVLNILKFLFIIFISSIWWESASSAMSALNIIGIIFASIGVIGYNIIMMYHRIKREQFIRNIEIAEFIKKFKRWRRKRQGKNEGDPDSDEGDSVLNSQQYAKLHNQIDELELELQDPDDEVGQEIMFEDQDNSLMLDDTFDNDENENMVFEADQAMEVGKRKGQGEEKN